METASQRSVSVNFASLGAAASLLTLPRGRLVMSFLN